MKLYNSLSRKLEEFKPLNEKWLGIYTCGPTVYDFVTIGNWRTYVLGDLTVRTMKYQGYEVDYVMNITDVGHLTGDNLGDADTGEDRMEKAVKRERKTAWEIAELYTKDFLDGFNKLNLLQPKTFCKATDYIDEQIELIKKIEKQGFAYTIKDGVYFDIKAYEKAGNKYGSLSTLDTIKEGARVEPNPEKRDPRDFGLWKFSPSDKKRDMEWDSAWGKGFPGWHIECSAMSMKHLGEQFDIHLGGEDLRSTHHPNEIAQAEAATGKQPFVRYWMHGAFLLVDGGRMGKSLGNAYTLSDIEKKGYSPMDLRYFYLSGHYRKQLNFTWEALDSAAKALQRLEAFVNKFRSSKERTSLSEDKLSKVDGFRESFIKALSNDFNFPDALAVVWEVVKSNLPEYDKFDLLMDFDQVLGLRLAFSKTPSEIGEVSSKVKEMLVKREKLRAESKFEEADKIREELLKQGYEVQDVGGEKSKVKMIG